MSHKQIEPDEFAFSPFLDLCIRWGRSHILRKRSDDLQLLEAEWDQLVKRGVDIGRDLADGLIRLSSRMDNALELLASDATLDLNQDDAALISAFEGWLPEDLEEGGRADSYRRLDEALLTLDALACLAATGDTFPRIADQTAFREKIRAMMDDLFFVRPLHTLRFIPINAFRRERLRYFSEDEHYLFPWYEEWSDLPPEALDVLAEDAAGWPKSAKLPDGVLFMLQEELKDDPALRARIQAQAAQMRLAFNALEEAHALRWFLAADEEAGKGILPEKVVEAGMVGAACRVAVMAIRAKTEPDVWKFRAGLCGLGLTDEERLRLMKPIEKSIREAKKSGRSLTGFAWKIGAFASEEAMARSFFEDWIRDLEAVAQQGFMSLPEGWSQSLYRKLLFDENPERLAALIAGLDALRVSSFWLSAAKILEALVDLPEGLAPPSFALGGERGVPDDEKDHPQRKEVRLDFLLVPMPEIQERRGKRYRPLLLEAETEKWRRALADAGLFYWGGMGFTENEQITVEVKDATSPSSIRIDSADYRLFLLGVSSDEEVLRAALEEPTTLAKVVEEGKTEADGVAWVLYVRAVEDSKTG